LPGRNSFNRHHDIHRHPEGRRLRGREVNDFVIAYEARGISFRATRLARKGDGQSAIPSC
jgi:hypothetical protein